MSDAPRRLESDPNPADEAHDLALRYLEGDITPDQFERLSDLLERDPAARAAFRALASQCTAVRNTLRHETVPALVAPAAPRPASIDRPAGFRFAPAALALAAAVLLAAAAVTVYLFANRPAPWAQPADPIAIIVDTTGALVGPDGPAYSGSETPPGEYVLEGGEAELVLTSAVNVKLRGNTAITVHNEMAATLLRGYASFNCPSQAKGFTVTLPDGSRVIDLGTAFTISLVGEAGLPVVTVIEGSVRVISAHPGVDPVTIGADQTATIEPGGHLVRRTRPTTILLTPDRSRTSPAGDESDIGRLLDDPFDYSFESPLDPMPRQVWRDEDGVYGYVSLGADSESIAFGFDRSYTGIVLDLYARTDYSGHEHPRSQNLTIELFRGDWRTPVHVETGFNGVTTKHDTPASYGRWTAPPHIEADRVRISREGEMLLLMEVRGAGVPYTPPHKLPDPSTGSDAESPPAESTPGSRSHPHP